MGNQLLPDAEVLAVDIRRLSLVFLWIRKKRQGLQSVRIAATWMDDPCCRPGVRMQS